MPAVIDIQNLAKSYLSGDTTTPVLHGVSLSIPEGQFVAIMGPSGSGKSTLMHILGFLDVADSGTYQFAGRDVTRLSGNELAAMRQSGVGFVFQAFFLLPHLTVYENVMLPLTYGTRSAAERRAAVDAAVTAVGLAHRRDFPAVRLSGGEKQRVAIARAIVNNPRVIFADEPTGNLDSRSGAQVMALLERFHAEGRTVIVVTHETTTAEHAERIIRFKDGSVVSDDKVLVRRTSDGSELAK